MIEKLGLRKRSMFRDSISREHRILGSRGLLMHNASSAFIALSALFLVLSCGRFIPVRDTSFEPQQSNTASNSTPGSDKAFTELLDKKHGEFKTLSPPVALDPNARITGKVLVASTESELDDRLFLSNARQARSLDELQNIIQIVCKRGRYVGDYVWNETGSKTKGYASDCNVSLIDYKANKVIARKSFSNSIADDIVLSGNREGDGVVMDKPFRDIVAYVQGFQYDNVIRYISLEERELINAAAQSRPDPAAALRGKIAVVSLIERGPISISNHTLSQFSAFESYEIPAEKIARKYEDLDTLVRIVCRQGSTIGVNEGAKQFASKCSVQLVDFKSMTVLAEKAIENKTLDTKISRDVTKQWIVDAPKDQIAEYLKSLPSS